LVPDNAILDLSRLQEAFDDDVIGIADLLDMALETGRKHVGFMNDGIRNRSIETVARAAHGVKGSASNVGAGNVTAVAAQIEVLTRAGSWDGVEELTRDLEQAYEDLRLTVVAYRLEVTAK
jgi:HPt (histidine-containing phosphotransfer) domain-containing protein